MTNHGGNSLLEKGVRFLELENFSIKAQERAAEALEVPGDSLPPVDKGRAINKENPDEVIQLFAEFFCHREPLLLKALIDEIEKCVIVRVLSQVNGNQKEAAKILGIKYTTLNEKVKRYKIRFPKRTVALPLRLA
jgi:DNA-binding protein Fis